MHLQEDLDRFVVWGDTTDTIGLSLNVNKCKSMQCCQVEILKLSIYLLKIFDFSFKIPTFF